jgi:hypothetical protein
MVGNPEVVPKWVGSRWPDRAANAIGSDKPHLGKWPTLGRSDRGNLADHSLYAVHEKRRAGLPRAGVGAARRARRRRSNSDPLTRSPAGPGSAPSDAHSPGFPAAACGRPR